VAEAILATKGLRYAKHGGVHAAFGEHVVKAGEMDPRYHRWLLDAFDRRITADYGVDVSISSDEDDPDDRAGQGVPRGRTAVPREPRLTTVVGAAMPVMDLDESEQRSGMWGNGFVLWPPNQGIWEKAKRALA
jgi:hypothetical protein